MTSDPTSVCPADLMGIYHQSKIIACKPDQSYIYHICSSDLACKRWSWTDHIRTFHNLPLTRGGIAGWRSRSVGTCEHEQLCVFKLNIERCSNCEFVCVHRYTVYIICLRWYTVYLHYFHLFVCVRIRCTLYLSAFVHSVHYLSAFVHSVHYLSAFVHSVHYLSAFVHSVHYLSSLVHSVHYLSAFVHSVHYLSSLVHSVHYLSSLVHSVHYLCAFVHNVHYLCALVHSVLQFVLIWILSAIYRALYNYEPREENDLGFRQGDTLTILNGWMFVTSLKHHHVRIVNQSHHSEYN